jgi:hypothetical protein
MLCVSASWLPVTSASPSIVHSAPSPSDALKLQREMRAPKLTLTDW